MKSEPDITSVENKIASLFNLFRQPARFQILLVIRNQPACVCHLETALGLRQASISQHLMILRKAGWVTTRREGRNIYYHLVNPMLISLIEDAAAVLKIPLDDLTYISRRPLPGCPCPQCNPDYPADYSCKSISIKKGQNNPKRVP